MSEKPRNNAQRFWEAYAEGSFVSLKRQGNGDHEGVLLDFGENEDALLGEEAPFSITRQELLDYDYGRDDQFAPCAFETLTPALSAVLQTPEFTEPTEPNRNRLQLIIRLIRDPSIDEPFYSVMVRTRDLVKDYKKERIGKAALTVQLRSLLDGRDKNFDRFCQSVLKYLDMEALSADQAAGLLYSNTPIAAEKYVVVLRILLETVPECELSVDKACRFLQDLLPAEADYAAMEESGRICSVNAERDILLKALSMCPTDQHIARQCMNILDNHENEDVFTIIEAISALGLHNEKSSISPLIECLGRDDMIRYRDGIEEALQILCSGPELIPKAIWGEDFSEYMEETPEEEASEEESLAEEVLEVLRENEEQDLKIEFEYWQKEKKNLPDAPGTWRGHDALSVFWQKRLRCALAAGGAMGSPLPSSFQNDEVMTVRIAAGGPE
jgi:hypothetical protein